MVAGAVILPGNCDILYLNDSKKLSAKKREELYEVIQREAVAVGVGYASPQRIDEINILQATYEAMREAVGKLGVKPQILLNDAVTIPDLPYPQVPIIKGDGKSASIAAASIVAKVTRDRLMMEYDKLMPEYGFASHKGYGAPEHIAALKNTVRLRFTGRPSSPISCECSMNRRQVGTEYERQAAAFLEERGCEVIERNYRCRLGEVDLIVRDGNYLVFVEVKYRQSERTGHPLEAVNPAKQRRISRTAVWYLQSHGLGMDQPSRFDVVGICGGQVLWLKDAFPFSG